MKFEKYPSLTNTYNLKSLIEMMEAVPKDLGWVVTEKLHGANFQFKSTRPVSGEVFDVRVGKRTGFTDDEFFKLNSSENFLNTQEAIKVAMLHIYYTRADVKEIEIDGEVYGGNIQKGIFYSRSKRFAAFDIKINGVFINHHDFRSITQEYNIPKVPLLYVGNLDECLKQSNTFNSNMPGILNESMPEGDNICEGVVIKPIESHFLFSGARVALKNKNDLWSEKASIKKTKQADPLEGNDSKIYKLLSGLVDYNRIESAISKIGSEMRLIPDLLEEVQRDILEAANEPAYESFLSDITVDITRDNTNKVRRLLSKRIVTLIKVSIQGRLLCDIQ